MAPQARMARHGHGHERRHPNLHRGSENGSLLEQAALASGQARP